MLAVLDRSTLFGISKVVAIGKPHCKDCGKELSISGAELSYPHEPERCRDCRTERRIIKNLKGV